MMMGILIACHAFRTNKSFEPGLLYLGAFIVDMSIIDAMIKLYS